MKRYFRIIPGSCGVLGKNTVFDQTVTPFALNRLHVMFQINTDDAILRVAGALLISERAASMLADVGATGFAIHHVEVGVDEQIAMLGAWKGSNIGCYKWLEVNGIAMKDDFGKHDHRLIVSERALEIFKLNGLTHAEISEFNGGARNTG